jgi:hypothetical protein
VAEGRATRTRAASGQGDLLTINVKLPAGYYEVFLEGVNQEQATGLWCAPANSGKTPPDGFMSIDTAMSWLAKPEQRPALIKNLSHVIGAGGQARERLAWRHVRPAADRKDWDYVINGRGNYETTRRLYAAGGIPVLEMFHDFPDWLGEAPESRFPENLVASARAWRDIALRWHKMWGALEVWNEPDIGAPEQPADQYAPLVKTLRAAMRRASVDTPVVSGAYSAANVFYIRQAALNGMLEESDIVSFHFYGDPAGLEGLVARHRDWLAESGFEAKPLWITEIGTQTFGKSTHHASLDGQRAAAHGYAAQAIEARACGVARIFPFVYEDYAETDGNLHFGMLRPNGSPLRKLAALAQAGRALAGMEYIGDIPPGKKTDVERIRVFAPAPGNASGNAAEALAVACLASTANTATSLTLPFRATSAQGIDGRTLPLTAKGDAATGINAADAGDGLVYLRAPRNAILGILKTDTPAMRLWRLGKTPAKPLPPPATLILQPKIDPAKLQASTARGYFLPENCARLPVEITVNNLGDQTRTVTLHANKTPNPGAAVAAAAIASATLTVNGNSRKTATLDIEIAALPEGAGSTGGAGIGERLLTITAEPDDRSRVGPVALTLISSPGKNGLAEYLRRSPYKFALTTGEHYRWENNANGALTFTHKPPATWGFTVTFAPNSDRWAYPRYSIPQEVNQSRVTGVLARVRCANPAQVRLMTWNQRGKSTVTTNPVIPADGDWHTAYVPLASFLGVAAATDAGDRITKISIGLNSQTDENTLEISDLYLLGE